MTKLGGGRGTRATCNQTLFFPAAQLGPLHLLRLRWKAFVMQPPYESEREDGETQPQSEETSHSSGVILWMLSGTLLPQQRRAQRRAYK